MLLSRSSDPLLSCDNFVNDCVYNALKLQYEHQHLAYSDSLAANDGPTPAIKSWPENLADKILRERHSGRAEGCHRADDERSNRSIFDAQPIDRVLRGIDKKLYDRRMVLAALEGLSPENDMTEAAPASRLLGGVTLEQPVQIIDVCFDDLLSAMPGRLSDHRAADNDIAEQKSNTDSPLLSMTTELPHVPDLDAVCSDTQLKSDHSRPAGGLVARCTLPADQAHRVADDTITEPMSCVGPLTSGTKTDIRHELNFCTICYARIEDDLHDCSMYTHHGAGVTKAIDDEVTNMAPDSRMLLSATETAASLTATQVSSQGAEGDESTVDNIDTPPAFRRPHTESHRSAIKTDTIAEARQLVELLRSLQPKRNRLPEPNPICYDLQLEGDLDGRAVSTFPDRGASLNFLSAAYVKGKTFKINRSDQITVHLANSKAVRSLGSVRLPFKYKGNEVAHWLDFHVLKRCIADVVLGDAFLKATSAFTKFANCISRTLRKVVSYRACFMGGKRSWIGGWLDGDYVGALPDTGCDVMLMSRSYATKRHIAVDNDPHNVITLQMGDLSTTRTTGFVRDLEWQFSSPQGKNYGSPHICDFWIVDDLACDVIFSDEFLFRTNALHDMSHCEFELDNAQLLLGAIKAIRFGSKKKPLRATAMQEWEQEVQKERLHQSEVESDMKHMSQSERYEAQKELDRRWAALEESRPIAGISQSAGSGTSSDVARATPQAQPYGNHRAKECLSHDHRIGDGGGPRRSFLTHLSKIRLWIPALRSRCPRLSTPR